MKRAVIWCSLLLLAGCGGVNSTGNSADGNACRCGSTDPTAPCEGNAIETTVKASRPNSNGHYYRDAWFRWEFNSGGGPAYCGEFANGDIWVAPKPGSSVQITRVKTNKGSVTVDDDPIMEALGLLSGAKAYGNFVAANNILGSLPVSYSTTTSLVAAKQRNESKDGGCGTSQIIGECVDAYNVVTILGSVPANGGADMLRPNISGRTKDFLTLADFDFSRLPRSDVVTGTDEAGLETIRQRWSHSTEAFAMGTVDSNGDVHGYSEGGRAFRAHIVHSDYGSGMAQTFTNDLMTIFSSDNLVEDPAKARAIAAMLTYGLDIYHARYDAPTNANTGTPYGRAWLSGAGQHNGRLLPPVFLAALMRNTAYANVLRAVGTNAHAEALADRGPPELRQIRPGVTVPVWGDETTEAGYWDAMLKAQCFSGALGTCLPTTHGSKNQLDPYGYIDGPANRPGDAYMIITLGVQRGLVGAMFMMPEICSIVNYPALVAYVDRTQLQGRHALPDSCAAPDPREDPVTCDVYRNRNCTYYGVTWGPDPGHPGQCIPPGTSGGNSRARFETTRIQLGTDPERLVDGAPLYPSYVSYQVEEHWNEIRGTDTGTYCLGP